MTGEIIEQQSESYYTELRVFQVGNDSDDREDADIIIPARDLTNRDENAIEITSRIQQWKGSGAFSIKDRAVNRDPLDFQYRGNITSGDRIEFWASYVPVGESIGPGGYGEDGYGTGGYGGSTTVNTGRRWTGWAEEPTLTSSGGGRLTLNFGASDFVFEVLSSRTVNDAFVNTNIAGTSDSILNLLIEEHAPEVNTDLIEDVDTRTSREFDSRRLKEIAFDLSETADALMASEGRSLIYKPLADIDIKHSLTWNDIKGDVTMDPDDTELVNSWRVDGGTGIQEDQLQEEVDDYVTVTENDPIYTELDPEKNRLDRIDVWTRRTGSEEDVSVRIQAANPAGDGPRDALDATKDIVNDTSSYEYVSNDGWREGFRMQREALPDKPWLIIDSGGEQGQEIGVNAAGVPAFRSYYPYSISIRVDNAESIEQYRLREDRKKETILSTFEAARDVGASRVRHTSLPNRTVSIRADTLRTHSITPGEVVDMNFPEVQAEGPWICIERTDTFDANTNLFNTDLAMQELRTM